MHNGPLSKVSTSAANANYSKSSAVKFYQIGTGNSKSNMKAHGFNMKITFYSESEDLCLKTHISLLEAEWQAFSNTVSLAQTPNCCLE